MTNYKLNVDDLYTLYEEYISGTKTATTYYSNTAGTDLCNVFTPYVSGTKATATNFKLSSGLDLSDVFKPRTYLVSNLTSGSITGARGIYSLKRLLTTYTGVIIKVRRASDGTTMSFYSTTLGTLTSGINGTGTPIATFLSATIGYVDTWYDQSGKNNHATQTATASQPRIDLTNKCVDFGFSTNTNLYLNIPNGTVPAGTLDLSYSFVVKYGSSNNTGNGGFIGAGNFALNQCNSFRLRTGINSYANYWHSKDILWNDATITVLPIISSVTYNGTTKNAYCYMNGVSKLSTTRTGLTTTATAAQTLGRTAATEYLKGRVYSILIFGNELPSADISVLNAL
jgi:hypothetical protein